MKQNFFFAIAVALSFANLNLLGESEKSPKVAILECEAWGENNQFSENYSKLTFIGSTGDVLAAYWENASKSIAKFAHREKVRHIFLNYGWMSEASLACLAHFPNVDELTLGISIEGVIVPPDDFRGVLQFVNLKRLELALHGLGNEHLKVLKKHKNLKTLKLSSGAREMISNSKLEKIWSPIDLNDESAEHIAEIKSLENLVIYWPDPKDGKVRFTEKAIATLFKSPALKSVVLDSRNFTKEGLESVKKMTLPEGWSRKEQRTASTLPETLFFKRTIKRS